MRTATKVTTRTFTICCSACQPHRMLCRLASSSRSTPPHRIDRVSTSHRGVNAPTWVLQKARWAQLLGLMKGSSAIPCAVARMSHFLRSCVFCSVQRLVHRLSRGGESLDRTELRELRSALRAVVQAHPSSLLNVIMYRLFAHVGERRGFERDRLTKGQATSARNKLDKDKFLPLLLWLHRTLGPCQ
mmetsp:Transcript_147055/g.382231  ORF Transcript_147055/g.382231 Transcript_147055/m.382231 type:complete len:187 (-) Transcript_147055:17-577(-)